MIQTAYNLTGLYAEGFDGTGQTIGIIDWCGSLTIQNDANVFSAQFGLPALTSSNFAITYIPTASTCASVDDTEINIDVEWAHAIAPGANINLIVPPSASFQDVDEAEYTAVNYGLANVISGSFNAVESLVPANLLATENLIQEAAAVAGISANFSSGDGGDYTGDGIPATVSTPADSPWATAVGGVTLALNSDNSIAWQAGWGNNETYLAQEGLVLDPPFVFGLIGGAGGGPSNCAFQDDSVTPPTCLAGFAKPSYPEEAAGQVSPTSGHCLAGGSLYSGRDRDNGPGSGSDAAMAGVGGHEPCLPDVLRTVGNCQPGGGCAARPSRSLPVFAASGSCVRYRSRYLQT